MGKEWEDGVVPEAAEAEAEAVEEVEEDGEAEGGLRARSRTRRGLDKERGAGRNGRVGGEQEGSVYLDGEGGIQSLDKANGMGIEKVEHLVTDKSLQNCETECITEKAENFPVMVNHQHPSDSKVEGQLTSEEECRRKLAGKEAEVEKLEEVTLLHESNVVPEMDFERILDEQETHDLYCPNCHSCITKRVILRKRKRTPTKNLSDAKREKIEPMQGDHIANTSAAETTDESHDTEPDVFRCLSCLSFFIPTGSGFRLFKIFGKREENENIQTYQQMPGRSQNWAFSLFDLMKGKPRRSELEDPLIGRSHNGYGDQADNIPRKEKKITSGASMSEAVLFRWTPQSDIKLLQDGATEMNSAASGVLMPANFHTIIEENMSAKVQLDYKENSQISVTTETKKNAQLDTRVKLPNEMRNEISKDGSDKENEVKKISLFNPPWQSKKHLPDEMKNVALVSEELPISISDSIGGQAQHIGQDSVKHVPIQLNDETLLFENINIKKAEKLHFPKEGIKGDVMVSVPEGMMEPTQEICLLGETSEHDLGLSVLVETNLPIDGETQIHLGEQTKIESRQTRQWDVLKATVYGGLLESIASLGVVSSAAGSDVSTLNIIALGLANLVGGLLVMIHNLVDLKSEQYKSIDGKEDTDHYWELLGRRGYFRLHATVALLSYILAGILPVVVYGFSFRKSDDKEYKLVAVAAASFLCISLLAIGKAHVQEGQKPYVKSLLYYLGLGLAASGLSYVVGMLIKKLLDKLGLFDSDVVVPTPSFTSILEATPRTPSWQPY